MDETPDFRSVLASIDKDGRRKWVDARIVAGRWRRLRTALAVPLIAFYLSVPFLSLGGHPVLRLDIQARRFWILGHAFWPQDLSYFVLCVLIGLVGTLLMVALLGRVFCGWFCPHNVFLEMVFRPLEALVAPRRASRARKLVKWGLFLVIAGALANAGTAIFTGPEAFRSGLFIDPIGHPFAAGFWAVLLGCILFNFGWFREQTCTIVCPYGRFQTAMLDPHTLIVAYDKQRGEPRGKVGAVTGDCIDCGLCVRVCPTAIDIRNGNQLECIHCAACVDACDGVMGKLGRKTGLVRYASEVQLAGQPRRILRPRTILYAIILTGLCSLLFWRVVHRPEVLASSLRPRVLPVFEADPEGRACIRAVLPVALVNSTDHDLAIRLELPAELSARVILAGEPLILTPGSRRELMPIVYLPQDRIPASHLDTVLRIVSPDGRLLTTADIAISHP